VAVDGADLAKLRRHAKNMAKPPGIAPDKPENSAAAGRETKP
jgi:hypothetical protein